MNETCRSHLQDMMLWIQRTSVVVSCLAYPRSQRPPLWDFTKRWTICFREFCSPDEVGRFSRGHGCWSRPTLSTVADTWRFSFGCVLPSGGWHRFAPWPFKGTRNRNCRPTHNKRLFFVCGRLRGRSGQLKLFTTVAMLSDNNT